MQRRQINRALLAPVLAVSGKVIAANKNHTVSFDSRHNVCETHRYRAGYTAPITFRYTHKTHLMGGKVWKQQWENETRKTSSVGQPSEKAALRSHEKSLFHRGFSPPIAFDDGCLKKQMAQFGYFQLYHSSFCSQGSSVVAGSGVDPFTAALVTTGTAQSIRFRIQEAVQGMLDRIFHQVAGLGLDKLFVDRYYLSRFLF